VETPPDEPAVTGDAALQDRVLEDLAEAVNYRHWLAHLVLAWLGDDPIEVGSGSGDYAADWAERGVAITATEAEPGRVDALRQRFAGHPLVTVEHLAVPVTEGADHSAVAALNVLEHIPDHVEALRGMARLVRPGGHVVLIVPAFPIAMSRFDVEIGHQRRYRRAGLASVAERAGLEVVRLHHVNALGLVGWILAVRLLGRRPGKGPLLRAYERLVPLLERLESRWHPPFGQSLLLVARKP
jgi:SAM-dependent methyltransferase